MTKSKKSRAIAILGPTASGKTGLAVKLAHEFNGEIISADSRQVYKYMNIGTGKDLDEYNFTAKTEKGKTKKISIPYHLIDVVSPNTDFNLSKYQKMAYKSLDNILIRGKLPILAGGSGLYLQAVVDNFNLSSVGANKKEREKKEKQGAEKLFKEIEEINPVFAVKINASDKKNSRRLARYLEILKQSEFKPKKSWNNYNFLLIGIEVPKEDLDKKIYTRLIERIEKEGMIDEVQKLHHDKKVSWSRLKEFGLEYKYISLYLNKELTYEEMLDKLFRSIKRFSRRQMTWFRRWEKQGAEINWIKTKKEAEKTIKNFLVSK